MEWVVCTPGGQRVITPGRLKNTDPFDPDPYNAITWAPSVARHIQAYVFLILLENKRNVASLCTHMHERTHV